MKIYRVVFGGVCLAGVFAPVLAGSLLSAQKFPKTFDDADFSQKIAVLAEGYDQYDTIFDDAGRCIKNCPYVGITVAEYDAQASAIEQALQQQLQLDQYENPDDNQDSETEIEPLPNPAPAPLPKPKPNPAPAPSPAPGPGPQPQPRPYNTNKDIPLHCPIHAQSIRVSSEQGMRTPTRRHDGIDLSVSQGTPVYAAADGYVIKSGDFNNGYGNHVIIRHKTSGTLYAHLSKIDVRKGDTVTQGQLIGLSGGAKNTPGAGRSTGPHLHYEIRGLNGNTNFYNLIATNPRKITCCPWSPAKPTIDNPACSH